jgi:hypothetical protein
LIQGAGFFLVVLAALGSTLEFDASSGQGIAMIDPVPKEATIFGTVGWSGERAFTSIRRTIRLTEVLKHAAF